MPNDLQRIGDAIRESSTKHRQEQENWFTNNPPIKEFQIQRETGFVQYGVWIQNEDFLVFYKNPHNGKYNFMHKIIIEKEIVRELYPLLEREENGNLNTPG